MQGEFAQYLPDWAYVPGVTPRHPEGWFSDLKDSFRTHTPLEIFGDTLLFRVGLYYLDHGYFWECHEVVEPLWLAAPARSAERIFFQLIIQSYFAFFIAEVMASFFGEFVFLSFVMIRAS